MNQRRSTDASKSRFVFKRGTLANKPRLVDIVRASADATPAPAPQGSEVTVDNTSQMKISGRSNETITLHSLYSIRRQEDQEKPISFLISHVGSCIIDLLPRVSTDAEAALEPLPITTVHIRDVKRTIVILPKVSGSVLLHDCFDSAIIIDCQQVSIYHVLLCRWMITIQDEDAHVIECEHIPACIDNTCDRALFKSACRSLPDDITPIGCQCPSFSVLTLL